MASTGPLIIGYDGSATAERALREGAALLAPRAALVVVVWEPDRAWALMVPDVAPAPIDMRAAVEVEQADAERASQLAEQGAALAREAGLDAEGLAVADRITVPETLVRLAEERAAAAIVVGTHGHGALRDLVLGSTAREVVKLSPCPVVVVRADEHEGKHEGKH